MGNLNVSVVFGGEAAPYGVIVHEDENRLHGAAYMATHPNEVRRPQEQYQFLQKAFEELSPNFLSRITQAAKRALARAVMLSGRKSFSWARRGDKGVTKEDWLFARANRSDIAKQSENFNASLN